MSQRGKKRSGVAKSFYLDNATIKKLVEQSEQEGISVNSLVNRVLKEHVDLRHPAKKYQSLLLTKEFVRKLLDKEEELFMSYGKEKGQKIFSETIIRGRSPKNLLSFKKIVKGFCNYGDWADYEEHVVGGKLIISLSHDMGEKWSKAMREYFYSGLKEIIGEDYPPEDVFSVVDTGLMIILPASIIEEL
jgi:predicted DNA-binding ribbon-helix-helix protein